MKFVVLALLAMLAVAAARVHPLTDEQYELLFTSWMKQHDKHYESSEFLHRFLTWKSNMDMIRTHNADKSHTYKLAMNTFGDMTTEEFLAVYTGYTPLDNNFLRSNNMLNFSDVDIPDSVDWVAKGNVIPVKDQGQCGSCWAFSAVGSMESAYSTENSVAPISLSEQQLVDCSQAQGNQGCNGGLMDQAFQYVITNGGICTEAAYPYTAQDGTCQSSTCQCAVKIAAFTDVAQTEDALTAAIVQQPISVAVDASRWQFYSGGVMSNCVYSALDHGVLAVGYGTDNVGGPYYRIKNSWGVSWG